MDSNIVKGICVGILLVITVLFGCLPYGLISSTACMSRRAVKIRRTLVSYLSCFAGGVFLCTCLLHLLWEGSKDMTEYFAKIGKEVDFPVFEAVTGAGFFLIAAVEQITHKLIHSKGHGHEHKHPDSLECKDRAVVTVSEDAQPPEAPGHNHESVCTDEDDHDHVVMVMQASASKAFLLLAALSFHTVFDGLTVGLQTSASKIWNIFIAVVVHKCLVSFCLGLHLFTVFKDQPKKAVLWVFLFAFITPIGIGIGTLVTTGSVNSLAKTLVATLLKGVATGTFMYVTFYEILKEEIVEKSGFLRLLFVILGFIAMTVPKVLEMLR